MKVLGTTQALSSARFEATTVLPLNGASLPFLVDQVMQEFKFRLEPQVQQTDNPAPLPLTVFKNGELTKADIRIGIVALIISQDVIMAMANSTDDADAVLDHLKGFLDEACQFRFHSQPGVRSWISNIVFTVEAGFAAYMNMLARVESVLHKSISHPGLPSHQFKRLVFGRDFGRLTPSQDAENSDFIIERRAGVPYADNCYFSAAGLRTSDHIAVLEEIENVLSAGGADTGNG